MSGDARPSLIKRLLASGARAFLTKPLDVAELLALLDRVADERQPSAQPRRDGGERLAWFRPID